MPTIDSRTTLNEHLREGNEHMREDFEREDLRDAMIIGSSLKVGHYEMASYIGAISHAKMLGQDEVQDVLGGNGRSDGRRASGSRSSGPSRRRSAKKEQRAPFAPHIMR
jgi:hypothetical protein